jgi:hypothetical protein
MTDRLDDFFELLKQASIEGGKVDTPNTDLGGRTNCGITQTTYDEACRRFRWPYKDVFELNPAECKNFYRDVIYKNVIFVEDKESHYNLFDAYVNGGAGGYRQVRDAARNIRDPLKMREVIYATREARFRMLADKNPTHGAPNLKGWLMRLERIKEYFKTGKITK